MVNYQKIKKNLLLLCIGVCLVTFITGLFYYFKDPSKMDYVIQKSTLPQNELWQGFDSDKILDRAYNIGISQVKDERALLELVKHAYQWDKNAMIAYVRIMDSEDDIPPEKGLSLDDFLSKYHDKIVDKQGNILSKPRIFNLINHQLYFDDFMRLLADQGYARSSSYVADSMVGELLIKEISELYLPMPESKLQKMIEYIHNSIRGGYKNYNFLADILLFKTGLSFKDVNRHLLYKMTDIVAGSIPQQQLKEAFDNYKIAAEHGSFYAMMRVGEAYLYGVGVEQNKSLAYAWVILAKEAYKKDFTNKEPDNIDKKFGDYIQQLSQQLLHHELSIKEIADQSKIQDDLQKTIITWDYDGWGEKYDLAPPQP